MSENLFKKEWHIPFLTKLQNASANFGLVEKIVFVILFAAFSISALFLIKMTTEVFLIEIPARGGSLTEGVVGSVGMINPLLAISDADRDLTSIIYSAFVQNLRECVSFGHLIRSVFDFDYNSIIIRYYDPKSFKGGLIRRRNHS